MDEFWTPQAVSALTGFLGVIIGALISWGVQASLLGRRIEADERIARRKFEFDKELAERKFDQERAQLIHKRRFELAETLLADAYLFRALMGYVRNGFSFEGEGVTRKGSEGEAESLKRMKDSYFVPTERLQEQSEFISVFMAKQFSAHAHFGTDVAKAFEFLAQSIHSVQIASGMLIELAGQDDRDPDHTQRLKADIWAGYGTTRKEGNEVSKKVEDGVLLFETLCRPVLEWKGE